MKKLILSMLAVATLTVANAQAPQKFSYQAVARNNSGVELANTNVGVRLSINDGSPNGTTVYQETHSATTNQFGLFTLQAGGGTVVSGTFASIAWGSGAKYLKTEIDPAGGTNYTISGTSELLSVPYALYANQAQGGQQGPTGPAGADGVDGVDGAVGPAGPAGPPGPAGQNGTNGTNGSQGLPGATGPAGPAGAAGPIGPTGATGATGSGVGIPGPAGPTGSAGAVGATGPAGAVGPAGSAGPTGAAGAVGATGPVGPTGAAGAVGATGAAGAVGPAGAAGPVGPVGPTGAAGANGVTGPTGPGGVTGTTGFIPKFNSPNTLGNSIMQENATGNVSLNISPSVSYRFYVYQQQLTANGDGQASLFGYRTRDSQNDGTGYSQATINSATLGYNFWGDVYTFGVAGINYNDYTRCAGTYGADVSGLQWGALGYRSSAAVNYGVYGNAAYTNGGGYMNSNTVAGVGAGFFGGIAGSITHGDVIGQLNMGERFAAYNLGDVYTQGKNVELVEVGNRNLVTYTATSTDATIYKKGNATLSNGSVYVAFDDTYKALLGETPAVTVTPMGECNGVYIASVDKNGFTIKELNGGTSNVSFSWIALGNRIDAANTSITENMKNGNFDDKIKGVMFNDGTDLKGKGDGIWWNGTDIETGVTPENLYPKKDKKEEPRNN